MPINEFKGGEETNMPRKKAFKKTKEKIERNKQKVSIFEELNDKRFSENLYESDLEEEESDN
jgi:hypothetical protein